MPSKHDIERRLGELEQPTAVSELPLASIDLMIAADEVEETHRQDVILLDGEPHHNPPIDTGSN